MKNHVSTAALLRAPDAEHGAQLGKSVDITLEFLGAISLQEGDLQSTITVVQGHRRKEIWTDSDPSLVFSIEERKNF